VADYTILFDGGAKNGTPDPQAYGSYHLQAGDRERLVSRVEFPEATTSNQAEYNALICAVSDLRAVIEKAVRQVEEFTIEIKGDSQLVLMQLQGLIGSKAWKCKEPTLIGLRGQATQLLEDFAEVTLTKVPRQDCVDVFGH
jgi:ribonuclease HI